MAKKKIKKFLKKVAPLAALALGATALGRRKQNNIYLDEEGGDRSDMRNYGPFSKGANYFGGPSKYVKSKTVLGKPGINRMDTSEVDFDYSAPSTTKYRNMDMGLEGYYKKGGRVGCGVAKKGFGRALKKGGKK